MLAATAAFAASFVAPADARAGEPGVATSDAAGDRSGGPSATAAQAPHRPMSDAVAPRAQAHGGHALASEGSAIVDTPPHDAHGTMTPETMTRGFARSLSAPAGYELAALGIAGPGRADRRPSFWGVEMAASVGHGVAMEVELSGLDGHVHGVRGLLQLGIARDAHGAEHGLQLDAEHPLDGTGDRFEALHLAEWHPAPGWDIVTVVGGGVVVGSGAGAAAAPAHEAVVGVFHHLDAHVALGIEVSEHGDATLPWQLRVLPESHIHLGEHTHWDTGVGVEWTALGWQPLVTTRLVYESSWRPGRR